MVFLPPGQEEAARNAIAAQAKKYGLKCLGWRAGTDRSGSCGAACLRSSSCQSSNVFSLRNQKSRISKFCCFISARKRKPSLLLEPISVHCHVRTVVYKGLLTPSQLPAFYADLRDPDFESSVRDLSPALLHQYPAQLVAGAALPFRGPQRRDQHHQRQPALAAREVARPACASLDFRMKFDCWKIGSATRPASIMDSNCFCARLTARRRPCSRWFLRRGSVLPKPRPNCETFLRSDPACRKPWDGPAALIFTDGCTVGAKLDRNGLRPLRYTLTSDGLLVVGSEVGIADLSGKEIVETTAPGPGRNSAGESRSGEFVRPKDSLRLREGIRAVSSGPSVLVACQPTRRFLNATARAEADDGGAGLERRSVPPAVPTAGRTRSGSGLEHGRRCAAGFTVQLSAVRCGITASRDSRRSRILRLIHCVKLT